MSLSSVKTYKLIRDHAAETNKIASQLMNDEMNKETAISQVKGKAEDLIKALSED